MTQLLFVRSAMEHLALVLVVVAPVKPCLSSQFFEAALKCVSAPVMALTLFAVIECLHSASLEPP